jgi:gas vesicle protein
MENAVTPTTEHVTRTRSVMIFLAGAVVGGAAALLLAPQSGQASRKQLLQYGRRTGETLTDWMAGAYAALSTTRNGGAESTVQETETRKARRQHARTQDRPQGVS